MSLDAILLHLIVPDRTIKRLHTSCWPQSRRVDTAFLLSAMVKCRCLVFLAQDMEDVVSSSPSVRWSPDWAVPLWTTRFCRMSLTPSLQRNTDPPPRLQGRDCVLGSQCTGVKIQLHALWRWVAENKLPPQQLWMWRTIWWNKYPSGDHSNTGSNKVHGGLMTLWVKQLVVGFSVLGAAGE